MANQPVKSAVSQIAMQAEQCSIKISYSDQLMILMEYNRLFHLIAACSVYQLTVTHFFVLAISKWHNQSFKVYLF